MYELHQIELAKMIDAHRREELSRSWAHHRGLITSLFGNRRPR